MDESGIKAGLNFTLITDGGDVDLLGEISGLGFYETVKEQAEEMEVFGYRLWVLTIQGLIRSKEAAGRGKDLRLIPELKALQALRDQAQKKKNS